MGSRDCSKLVIDDRENLFGATPRSSNQKMAVLSKKISTYLSIYSFKMNNNDFWKNEMMFGGILFHLFSRIYTLTIVSCKAGLLRYSLAFAAAYGCQVERGGERNINEDLISLKRCLVNN